MTDRPLPDSDYIPPPRSLLYLKPVPPEEGGGLEIACDCATITHLVIDDLDQLTEPRDIAVTCDGCNSVRWFTVGLKEGT